MRWARRGGTPRWRGGAGPPGAAGGDGWRARRAAGVAPAARPDASSPARAEKLRIPLYPPPLRSAGAGASRRTRRLAQSGPGAPFSMPHRMATDTRPLRGWLMAGHSRNANAEAAPGHGGHHPQHSWWQVMCLTGVDYFFHPRLSARHRRHRRRASLAGGHAHPDHPHPAGGPARLPARRPGEPARRRFHRHAGAPAPLVAGQALRPDSARLRRHRFHRYHHPLRRRRRRAPRWRIPSGRNRGGSRRCWSPCC